MTVGLPKEKRQSRQASAMLERFGLPLFLVVLLAIAALASPAFLKPANLLSLLTLAAPLGMVVLGQTFVILVRGLDLSVASLMATVAVLATTFKAKEDSAIPLIFVAAIVLSAAVGLINGWLVTKAAGEPVSGDARHDDHPSGHPLRLYRRSADQHVATRHALSFHGPVPRASGQSLGLVFDDHTARRLALSHCPRPPNLHGGRQPRGRKTEWHLTRSHYHPLLRHLLGLRRNWRPLPAWLCRHRLELGGARIRTRLDRCRGDGRSGAFRWPRQSSSWRCSAC